MKHRTLLGYTLAFLLAASALVVSAIPAHAQTPNYAGQAFASTPRTASQYNSADLNNAQWKGAHVVINVTAVTGAGTYQFVIQGKDSVSSVYYNLLTSSAITAAGTTVLKLYPGITASAGGSASDILPKTWRVQANGASSPSQVWSVGFVME